MDQIVFFDGKNLFIPEYFIKSICKKFCKKYKIIQVSDAKTNKIDGVDVYIKAIYHQI